MLGYDNLMNYFKINFALMQHHKYSLAEIENMLPWERMTYITLLSNYIKEKETERKEAELIARSQSRINKR